MASDWYVQMPEQVVGPLSSAQLKQWAESGQVTPETQLGQHATGPWFPATRVKGLFPATSAAPSGRPSVSPPIAPPVPPAPLPPVRAVLPPPPPPASIYPPPPPVGADDPLAFLAQDTSAGTVPYRDSEFQPAPRTPYGPVSSTYARSEAERKRWYQSKNSAGYMGGLAVVVAVVLSFANRNGWFTNKQREFEEGIRVANSRCPMQIDEYTRCDRIVAGPNLTCTFVYTVTVEMDANMRRAIEGYVRTNLRNEPRMKKLLDMGCKIRVKYLNRQGQVMLEFGV